MMTKPAIQRLIAAALVLGTAADLGTSAAGARTLSDTWPLLASDSDGSCRLDIAGNGKFMMIRAAGLNPGETAHFGVTNAAMKPIDWTIRADSQGGWSLVYLPLLWNNGDGTVRDAVSHGTVAVTIAGAQCQVAASAPWTREIRVIP